MDERASRVFVALSVLVLLWIGVYWLWEPSTPRVSYGGDGSSAVAPDPSPPIADPGLEVPAPEIMAPGFRAYTLKKNDSFESIAREQWGDASLWTVVARANPLKDPKRLRNGQVIRLPLELGNIQGVAFEQPAPVPTPQPKPAPVSSPERKHVVRSGDTLSGLAKRYLGSSAKARVIYELNRDRLKDMHSLRLGQELRIPPESAGG